RAELVAQGGSAFRVVDRRLDLAAVPDDALVLQETRHVARPEPGDAIDVEPGKRLAERGALAENRQPAQAGLKAFEADLLEEAAIVGDRRPPFLVVIGHVERVVARPPAAGETVGMMHEACGEPWCCHVRRLVAEDLDRKSTRL